MGVHSHLVIRIDTDSYLCIHLGITGCMQVSVYLSMYQSVHLPNLPSFHPSFYYPPILLCVIYPSFYLRVTCFPVVPSIKNLPAVQETWVRSLGGEEVPEKEMATHSSILAWRIPWTEEAGGLQSMGWQEPDTT